MQKNLIQTLTRSPKTAYLFLGIIAFIFILHAASYNFISDDSFISLRYANNLAEGKGLVFNEQDPVEGFTSPLWVFILSGIHLLGFDLLISSRLLGIFFALLSLFLSYSLTLKIIPQNNRYILAVIAPLIISANGSFACWSASGMETPLYLCLILASILSIFSKKTILSSILTSLLLWTRPEGIILFVAFSLFQIIWLPKQQVKKNLIFFLTGSISLAILFISRYLYYKELLPNTYYVKMGFGLPIFQRGVSYFMHYAQDHEGLILILGTLAYGLFKNNKAIRFLAAISILLWLITIAEGGDGLPMYRFSLPSLPLLAILEVYLIKDIYQIFKKLNVLHKKIHLVLIATISLIVIVNKSAPLTGAYDNYIYQKEKEIPRWTLVGKWFQKNAKTGESIALVPIGAVSYYSRLKIIDMLGLTDKHIARINRNPIGKSWAGHEKYDGQYVLNKKPTYLLLGNVYVTKTPRNPNKMPFIIYKSPYIYEREKDIYESLQFKNLYQPRCVQIGENEYLNFFELKTEHRKN